MTLLVILIIVGLLALLSLATDSKKETRKERYADAIEGLATNLSDGISSTVQSLAEPANKKELRMAREQLAIRHGKLYRFYDYEDISLKKELLFVDDRLGVALNIVGISEERWNNLANRIFHIGSIRKLSRTPSNYLEKYDQGIREAILERNTWHGKAVKDGVSYFNIPISDWIKYGDAVIEMYNLEDDSDYVEFGYSTVIKAMKNNFHLI